MAYHDRLYRSSFHPLSFSDTCYSPLIDGPSITKNDAHRAILVGNDPASLITFTPIEYRLLTALLSGNAVADEILMATFATTPGDQLLRKAMERHIENIKSKLSSTGLSIRRVYRYGYILLHSAPDV